MPRIVFARGAYHALEALAAAFDVVSVDWTVAPEAARRRVGEAAALQGNLDPCVLNRTVFPAPPVPGRSPAAPFSGQ